MRADTIRKLIFPLIDRHLITVDLQYRLIMMWIYSSNRDAWSANRCWWRQEQTQKKWGYKWMKRKDWRRKQETNEHRKQNRKRTHKSKGGKKKWKLRTAQGKHRSWVSNNLVLCYKDIGFKSQSGDRLSWTRFFSRFPSVHSNTLNDSTLIWTRLCFSLRYTTLVLPGPLIASLNKCKSLISKRNRREGGSHHSKIKGTKNENSSLSCRSGNHLQKKPQRNSNLFA